MNGKRILAMLLSAAMTLTLSVCTVWADGDDSDTVIAADEAQPDSEGTLSFGNLRTRMLDNYYPLLALQESIDDLENRDYEWRAEDLRDNLNMIASAQWAMISMSPLATELNSYDAMKTQYQSMREQFDDIRSGKTQKEDEDALRQYRNAQNQAVAAGESLYIAVCDMTARSVALDRQIAQLDRTVEELELRYQLGQVSELLVEQAKSGRAQAVSGRMTLNMNIDTCLLQLKSMVGAELGEPLELGPLPKVTDAQLAEMSLEEDLERAMAASYELFDAKKQLDDFQKNTYDKVIDSIGSNEKRFEVSQVKHGLQALKYNYENTLLTYELNFRTLYAQIKDCAQIVETKRVVLSAQEKVYASAALKYEQGEISANALADASDELESAKDAVSDAERELFSKYRSYFWAVEYGILNG
ncbi:MAG: TolC family protein [Oscillospiraceae bacterium]|nr:TolC family protein [Oscillospiraceae bacterium]